MVSTFVAVLFVVFGGVGLYFGIFGGESDDRLAETILSGLLVLSGTYYLALHSPLSRWTWRLLSDKQLRLLGLVEDQIDGDSEGSGEPIQSAMTRTGPDLVYFSVIGSEDSESLIESVETFLEKNPKVGHVGMETGRWYAVPDGDDLPGWVALRVGCKEKHRDQLMKEAEAFVVERVGVCLLRIQYY